MLHGWTLNDGAGMTVQARDGGGRLGVFKASMHYEIVLSDDRHEGKWRVSTRGYAYELVGAGDQKAWSMHWHPVGRSGITSPHFHLPPYGEHQHPRSSRHTLETAVQWCIEMGGAAVDGWERCSPRRKACTSCGVRGATTDRPTRSLLSLAPHLVLVRSQLREQSAERPVPAPNPLRAQRTG